MEAQLQSLIDKIQKEGVEEAKLQSNQIVEDAKCKAAQIIEKANKEATCLIEKANAEAAALEENAKKTLQLAARDSILTVKQQIQDLLEKIVRDELRETLSADMIGGILLKLINKWDWNQAEIKGIEVLLSKDDLARVEDYFLGRINDEIKKGVTFRLSKNVDCGFRIGMENGNFHYDFTKTGVAEQFAGYLNPKLANLIKTVHLR